MVFSNSSPCFLTVFQNISFAIEWFFLLLLLLLAYPSNMFSVPSENVRTLDKRRTRCEVAGLKKYLHEMNKICKSFRWSICCSTKPHQKLFEWTGGWQEAIFKEGKRKEKNDWTVNQCLQVSQWVSTATCKTQWTLCPFWGAAFQSGLWGSCQNC